MNQPAMEPFEPGKDLKVFVACESSRNAQAACALLERLGRTSEAEGRLIYSWWNFEVLTIDALRKLAAVEAAAADMVFIAVQDGPALPVPVIDWISQWLAVDENRTRALVALLDPASKTRKAPGGLCAQLKKVAELGHMDFFAKGAEAKLEAALKRGSAPPSGNLSWRQDLYATNCRTEREHTTTATRNTQRTKINQD